MVFEVNVGSAVSEETKVREIETTTGSSAGCIGIATTVNVSWCCHHSLVFIANFLQRPKNIVGGAKNEVQYSQRSDREKEGKQKEKKKVTQKKNVTHHLVVKCINMSSRGVTNMRELITRCQVDDGALFC
jgi:hypothetical protein